MNDVPHRIVARYLLAKDIEHAAPIKKLVEAIRIFETSGEMQPLLAVFTSLVHTLEPGGKYTGWYQSLAPGKRRDFQVALNNLKAGQKMIEAALKGTPLPDRFRTALPHFVKMLEKLNVALAATDEAAVLTHGPWKINNLAGIDDDALKTFLVLLDKADALLHGKFGQVLHGTINLGNKAAAGAAFASYVREQDTVQINMRAFGREGDMLKSFIHELGHRYWFKFCQPAARVEFKKLSTEPQYATSEIHYDGPMRHRMADEYLEIAQGRKKRKKINPSPELVTWLRGLHTKGQYVALDQLAEQVGEPGVEDQILALARGTKDETLLLQGEKVRDGISVSEYGATKVTENFAEGFAYYVLKWDIHPDMVLYFENL